MSIDNGNVQSQSNNRNDESNDQPPPAKRRKIRKQTFTEYKKIMCLINKLSKEYDQIFSRIIYVERKNGIKK